MQKYTFTKAAISVRYIAFIIVAILLTAMLPGFGPAQNQSEKLLGLTFDDEKKEVTIKVASTGCTAKNYFQFNVNGSVIEVVRMKRDDCKRMPFAASFTYTMAEAGILPNKMYTIKNSFITNPETMGQ